MLTATLTGQLFHDLDGDQIWEPQAPSLEPALGYGAGVRWRSPVGPLKLDIAYGQEVRKFRLHFSVGVVF